MALFPLLPPFLNGARHDVNKIVNNIHRWPVGDAWFDRGLPGYPDACS
jgi:hypothetical protein